MIFRSVISFSTVVAAIIFYEGPCLALVVCACAPLTLRERWKLNASEQTGLQIGFQAGHSFGYALPMTDH